MLRRAIDKTLVNTKILNNNSYKHIRLLSTNNNNDLASKIKAHLIPDFEKATPQELHHSANVALAVLTPVALVLSPSILNLPVDLALTGIISYHSHHSMKLVIEDYVPKDGKAAAKTLLWLPTSLIFIGLLKFTLCGDGLTETVKAVWREPAQSEQ